MTSHPRNKKHSGLSWIQEIIVFIYNYVLSCFKPNQEYIDDIYTDHWKYLKPQKDEPQIADLEQNYTSVPTPDTPVEDLVKHEPHSTFPTLSETWNSHKSLFALPIPTKLSERYKPLIFPPILQALPANLANKLPRFDGEDSKVTAEEHIQNLENLLDLFEIEEDDVHIRMFALSLQGKNKSWFKDLPAASIIIFYQFNQVFLDRWMIIGNEFLIIGEYKNLKRQPGETVQEFSARFNKVYNAIPTKIKPPLGWALLHYPSSFDPEVEFHIRKREPSSLEEMQNIEITVEYNIWYREEKLNAIKKDQA